MESLSPNRSDIQILRFDSCSAVGCGIVLSLARVLKSN
jgi:hypothetical protein